MAYGFNLGQIEGLDSSVQTVTLTIANQSESNTYTLNKVNEEPLVWSDSPDFESVTVYIMLTDGDAKLYVVAFTESDVGVTYNIMLSTSVLEDNFKSATELVINQTVPKTKVFYVDSSDVSTAVVGFNDLPLYRDRSLTERARSYDVNDYDVYIIHSVDNQGNIVRTYNPYDTFSHGSYFIISWGKSSPSDPYQPLIGAGEIID